MADKVRQRRDTAANWTAANPILLAGQLGFETDTLAFKLGDGVTAWNSLAYVVNAAGSVFPIATAGGTVDAITANYVPDIVLVDKALMAFVASGANTSTTPTFSPDGSTARTITKNGGQPLVAGDIPGALAVVILEYNLANTRYEMVDVQGDTLVTAGALINSATSKATPVDADMIGLMDSAAANVLKKLSWANVKVTLKAYFDTIYQSLATFAADVRAVVITGFSSGAGTVAATDTILQAFNKIDGNFNAQLAVHRMLNVCGCAFAAGLTGADYFMSGNTNGAARASNSSVGGTIPPILLYIDSADFPTINGKAPRLRVKGSLWVNDVAPTGTFAFGLFPISSPGSTGAAGVRVFTMGTVIAASVVSVATPAADSENSFVSADFDLPANGWYAIGFNYNTTAAANSFTTMEAYLQTRNT